MSRVARVLFLAVALLWAQQGALWHALEHAAHDAHVAELDHEVEKCVAYDALGHALEGNAPVAGEPVAPLVHAVTLEFLPVVLARIVFDSRAPPFSA